MINGPGITLSGSAPGLFPQLSLRLNPGEWSCLLGASGVGKSTLLRLIAGLETHVAFGGSIVADEGQPVPPRASYMAQTALLLPWATVTENVTLGPRLRGQHPDMGKATDLITKVGLADHAHKKPSALSGGQQQRAALARTLMEDRPLVLLDEPFSALDVKTRTEMQDMAFELLSGRTVLLVTHDPAEAARIAHAVNIINSAGIEPFAMPASPLPRPYDMPETLQLQAQLFARIRGAA